MRLAGDQLVDQDVPSVLALYPVGSSYPDGGGVGHRVRRILGGLLDRHGVRSSCLRLARDFSPGPDRAAVFSYSSAENRYAVIRRLVSAVPPSSSVMLLSGEPLEYEAAWWLRRERGIRCASVFCTDSPHYYAIARRFSPIIDRHIALTAATAERIAAELGTDVPTATIHTGVDVVLPRSPADRRDGGRQWLNVVYVGRIVKAQKEVYRLVDVLHTVLGAGARVRLAIIGSGPDESALRSSFQEAGVAECVRFTGHLGREEVSAEMAQADVLLLTSATEGLCNALLEGMMHSCVPVVMDIPGIREVVTDGAAGFVVPQGDCTAMAQRVVALAARPELLAQLRDQAYQTARLRFSRERMVDGYAALFQELLAMGPFRGDVGPVPIQASRLDRPWLPNWLTVLLRRVGRRGR